MSIWESVAMAVKNIISSKTRTLLTMLGIVIGVAAVIVIVGLGNGLEQYMTDSFSGLGTNTLTVSVSSRGSTRSLSVDEMYGIVDENSQHLDQCSPTVSMKGYVKIGSDTVSSTSVQGVSEDYVDISGASVSSGRNLQYSDMKLRAKVCVIGAYLDQCSPTVSMMGTVKIGTDTTSSSVTGVSEAYLAMMGYEVASGRGIQYSDVAQRGKVCVVGAYVDQAYYGGSAVGQTLRVGGQSLTIVGVLVQQAETLEEGGRRRLCVPALLHRLPAVRGAGVQLRGHGAGRKPDRGQHHRLGERPLRLF